MTFLIIFGVIENLYFLRVVIEGKTGKEIPESSRLVFLEKLLANNFALSDVEHKTSDALCIQKWVNKNVAVGCIRM